MRRRRSGRATGWLITALVAAGLAAAALIWLDDEPPDLGPGAATRALPVALEQPQPADCAKPGPWADAASSNAASLTDMPWSLSGQDRLGWEIYAPLVGQELATACSPGSQGFAAALARWQASQGLPANGRMDAPSFEAMWVTMLRRRPFVQAMRFGCPAPAAASELELARPDETFGNQTTIMARPPALEAYRQMLAAARAEVPAIRTDPQALKIISGFRAPQADGGDCPPGRACSNLTRASCSAHRTGLAFDLYLGSAPGRDATSTEDDNRLYQSRTLAYRWLVGHAARFGFLPYPYEPWHWEWTMQTPGG